MEVRVSTPDEALKQATRFALDGDKYRPRLLAIRERRHATLIVDNPHRILEMDLRNPRIGVVEALQLVGQTHDPETAYGASAVLHAFTDDGIFHGGYGVRAFGQLGRVVELLTRDQDSRQAVVSIYDGTRDLGVRTKDVPCTTSLQFFIRDGLVELRTTMRSNDVWLGLPYDLFQFITLQGAVAAALGRKMGPYVHTVGSLHLYEHDVAGAREFVDGREVAKLKNVPLFERELWAHDDWERISRKARTWLHGDHGPTPATLFEKFLAETARKAQAKRDEALSSGGDL